MRGRDDYIYDNEIARAAFSNRARHDHDVSMMIPDDDILLNYATGSRFILFKVESS